MHEASTSSAPWRRPLSTSEHLWWLLGLNNCVLTARVRCRVPVEVVADALRELQERHSLLQVRVDEGRSGLPPELVADGAPAIALRYVRDMGDTWKTEMDRELNTPIDGAGGPLARAVIVDGDAGSDLILCVHHAICDAIALVTLAYEWLGLIAARLGGCPTPETRGVDSRPIDELLPPEITSWRAGVGRAARLLRSLVAESRTSSFRIPTGTADAPLLVPTRWIHRIHTEVESQRLFERCKREGATVTGALYAALFDVARSRYAPEAHRQIGAYVATNVRRLLQPALSDDALGIYVVGMTVRRPAGTTDKFWEIARSVSREVRARMERREPLDTLMNRRMMLRRMVADPHAATQAFNRQMKSAFLLTNLGNAERSARLDPLDWYEMYIGAGGRALWSVGLGVVAFTFRGRLSLTYGYRAPPVFSDRDAQDLVERTEEQLLRATQMASGG